MRRLDLKSPGVEAITDADNNLLGYLKFRNPTDEELERGGCNLRGFSFTIATGGRSRLSKVAVTESSYCSRRPAIVRLGATRTAIAGHDLCERKKEK